MPRRTAAEADQTRETLISVARALFAERGFDHVSAAEIAEAAEVTRGALYHHFGGKVGLFKEVAERVFADQGRAIMEHAESRSETYDALVAGCEAFLRHSQLPEYRRIVMVDAPSVLGTAEWKAMDDEHTTSSLREALNEAAAERESVTIDVDAATEALSGAMNQLSSWIVTRPRAEAPETTARAVAVVRALLASILGLAG